MTSPSDELAYPRVWQYRVIGLAAASLRAAIALAITDTPYEVVPSRTSRGGRYQSFIITVTVRDAEHQAALHTALGKHPDVHYVL